MIIDIHTHFYPQFASENPEQWAKKCGEEYWGKLVGKRADGKRSLQGFPTEEKFLADMREAGVERAVIQGWYWQTPSICELMNNAIAELVKRHKDKLMAFAAVCPTDEESSLKIVREARAMGFSGIGELHNAVQNFSFNSKEFHNFAQACADENLPICIHITEGNSREYLGKTPTDNKGALELARKFPQTKFIFAHWFGGEILDAPTEYFDLPNILFDSAATPLQFQGDKTIWAKCATKFPQKTAFGSDYPIRLYPRKFKTEELATIVNEASEEIPPRLAQNFFAKNFEKFLMS